MRSDFALRHVALGPAVKVSPASVKPGPTWSGSLFLKIWTNPQNRLQDCYDWNRFSWL